MKITIIGAAGVRTPLILRSILRRQDKLGIDELALMDIDGARLELIGALTSSIENSPTTKFFISRTTDPKAALNGADFVITTFRVGGIGSRVIDERVPLDNGVLGQETTGAGGFAMGVRSIPVMLDYIHQMKALCPGAWLINFANPAGMLTEAVIRNSSWRRVVGICDGPASMQREIANLLSGNIEEIYLDYFGLNHLGWIRRILYHNQDQLPSMLALLPSLGEVPGLPFDPQLVAGLGMVPNEYLYYYYYRSEAIHHLLQAGLSRGEQIARLNQRLFDQLRMALDKQDLHGMESAYQAYLDERNDTYMAAETGKTLFAPVTKSVDNHAEPDEGYAGVALNLIEGLLGKAPRVQILNVPNHQAIIGIEEAEVVEIPTLVSHDRIQPLPVGEIPDHCLGLMKQVKHFEHLTIEAAIERSYQKALLALTTHPLVGDYSIAKLILDGYITQHQGYFPDLH